MSISSVTSSSYLYDYGKTASNSTSKTSSKDSGENPFFSKVDTDQDGTVSQSELQSLVDDITASDGQSIDVNSEFSQYDTNGDGTLSDDELRAFMEGNDLKPAQGGPQGPPPPGGAAPADGSSQTGQVAQTSGTDTDSSTSQDYNMSEFVMGLMSYLQNYLMDAGSSDSASQTNSLYGSQDSSYQSDYAKILEQAGSQYTAQA